MVSFVSQRNNLIVKKTLTNIFLFMHIILYLQNGYYIKNWPFYKKQLAIFVIEGKKQVSTARTMSALS